MAQSMAEVLIERGARETAIKNILLILSTRFPESNVETVNPQLERNLSVDHLTQLLQTAVEVSSFEAFLQVLDM